MSDSFSLPDAPSISPKAASTIKLSEFNSKAVHASLRQMFPRSGSKIPRRSKVSKRWPTIVKFFQEQVQKDAESGKDEEFEVELDIDNPTHQHVFRDAMRAVRNNVYEWQLDGFVSKAAESRLARGDQPNRWSLGEIRDILGSVKKLLDTTREDSIRDALDRLSSSQADTTLEEVLSGVYRTSDPLSRFERKTRKRLKATGTAEIWTHFAKTRDTLCDRLKDLGPSQSASFLAEQTATARATRWFSQKWKERRIIKETMFDTVNDHDRAESLYLLSAIVAARIEGSGEEDMTVREEDRTELKWWLKAVNELDPTKDGKELGFDVSISLPVEVSLPVLLSELTLRA